MTEIKELDAPAEVDDLRDRHMAALAEPLDGMWEAFIGMSTHWEIRRDDERIGYFCVNGEGRLLRFHLAADHEDAAANAFRQAVDCDDVGGAIVSTAEGAFLALCLDHQRAVEVHTHLYRDHHSMEVPPVAGLDDLAFDVVREDERPAVEAFTRGCFKEDPGEWLTSHLANLVSRDELLLLRHGDEMLAYGELRRSDSQPSFADLGVIVSPAYRSRGLATHALARLKALCAKDGLEPICSTAAGNLAAQKAILKVGFVSRHRLLEVLF